MSCRATQYVDLYDANAARFPGSGRMAAREALAEAGECLDDALAYDYGVNVERMALPVDVAASFRCGVPTVSTAMAVVVNDSFAPMQGLQGRLPEGVRFMSLRQALTECPQLVEPYLSEERDATPLTRLNDLMWQDGVLIHVSRGVKLDKPLQLVNIFSAPVDLMAVRRVLVIMEEGSSARLLVCDHTQQQARQRYLGVQLMQIDLKADARLAVCDVEEASPLTTRRHSMRASLARGSKLSMCGCTLSGGDTANDLRVSLDGDGSEALLSGMAITAGSQRAANTTTVAHHGEHTHSNQLFKYVADGESHGDFRGRIVVDEQARFTEAYQTNRNLLASHTAHMHAEPTLEIYCDEVKCSHGAATGQLDDQALFYMRTRGIEEATARRMLMEAFVADVIDTVEIDGLRDRLRMLVERRFDGGEQVRCADCGGSDLTANCINKE